MFIFTQNVLYISDVGRLDETAATDVLRRKAAEVHTSAAKRA